jgi:hypothetical protein
MSGLVQCGFEGPHRTWVMSAGRDPAVAAVHLCFAPKPTPLHCNPPLSAEIVAKVFLH